MTAITVLSGSVTAYTASPWNNTQASGLRKDERNSPVDSASCPTNNTTSTPKQRNRGKCQEVADGTQHSDKILNN